MSVAIEVLSAEVSGDGGVLRTCELQLNPG
jgi:hypothetical protein